MCEFSLCVSVRACVRACVRVFEFSTVFWYAGAWQRVRPHACVSSACVYLCVRACVRACACLSLVLCFGTVCTICADSGVVYISQTAERHAHKDVQQNFNPRIRAAPLSPLFVKPTFWA